MKIRSLRFAPYRLPFARPFVTARQELTVRQGWLVEVRDTAGAWGIGEAAPLPGFGMETHAEAGQALGAWAKSLPGTSLQLGAALDENTPPAFGLATGFPAAPAARHGLELALLDLAARAAGMPLAQWLHPGVLLQVAVNGTLGAAGAEQTVREAAALAAQGFGTIKAKVGAIAGPRAAQQEIGRVTALRQVLGPTVRLRLDANGGWPEAAALDVLRSLASLDIEYLEQPLPAADLAGMARLAARSPIPLAADEAVGSPADAEKVLAAGAARVLILKPMALGGVLALLAVARLAARHETPVVVTTTLEGAYARLGAAHAAAALGGMLPAPLRAYAHGLATGSLLAADLTPGAPHPSAGTLPLPRTPGLGLPRPREHLFG